MQLSEALDLIESCKTLGDLQRQFQAIVESYGFSSYALIEVGVVDLDEAFLIPTSEKAWSDDYKTNGFVHHDPVLSRVRRVNTPFTWSDAPVSVRLGKRKPESMRLMEAARDHGFRDGLIVPVHVVDRIGRPISYSCGFFWRDRKTALWSALRSWKMELHIVLIYWAQAVSDKRVNHEARCDVDSDIVPLSDRERQALQLAAQGKTGMETAALMACSNDTIETFLRRAMRKLGAVNKTQAVVLAIKHGLIDL